MRTPDGERVLRPWDAAWFVRGERGAHQLRNDTDEPARVVFFSTVADPEVAVYPDDGKIGVIAAREPRRRADDSRLGAEAE